MRLHALAIGLTGLLALLALGGIGHAYDKAKWPSEQCERKCAGWPSPSCQNIDYCISACRLAPNLRQTCLAAEQQHRAARQNEQSLEAKEAAMGCNQKCRTFPNPQCQNIDFCVSQCRSNSAIRQDCAGYVKQLQTQTCRQRCDTRTVNGKEMVMSMDRVCRDLNFCISTCHVDPLVKQVCKANGR